MSETGQQVATRTPEQRLLETIRSDDFGAQIEMVLPPNVTKERFVRSFVTAIMTKPELVKADPQSVILAAIRCAQDGLLPDGKQAAITAFGNDATYMPMIGGLRKVLADYGWTLRTRVVYQGDDFEFTEEPPVILHRPAPVTDGRGQLIYAYAIATHKDGRRLQRVAFPDEIAKRKAIAKTKNVWEKWPAEMWEKSVGHMLFDEIPLGVPDEERERIARIVTGWEASPAQAVDAIYGPATPQHQLSAGEPAIEPPVVERPVGDDDAGSGDLQSSSSEQAVGGAEPAAADGSSPTPEPTLGEPQIEFGVPAQVIEGALQTTIASQSGKTVETILEHPAAEDWLRWALGESSTLDPDEQAAVEIVVRDRMPQLLEAA